MVTAALVKELREKTGAGMMDCKRVLTETDGDLEKKEGDFRFTYSDNEYLYVARGYGIQETGGYSISVEDCYLSDTAICVKTRLQGPKNGEEVTKAPSYPFIVLKLELREEEVLFQ